VNPGTQAPRNPGTHFRVGLNPYGVAYTVGLQGPGTPRANPAPIGLRGFIDLARRAGAQSIELDWRWLTPMRDDDLDALRADLAGIGPIVCSFWLPQERGETLSEAIRCASRLGSPLVRLHLTPVLEGARARWGARWQEMLEHARETLRREAPRAADAGLALAIENHQDLGSEELIAIAGDAGANVGIVLDTGNPFSVGEDPVAFTTRAAPLIRHVHLKDYRAQMTPEGFRLVRCAVGDGCVPFSEMAAVLAQHSPAPTASIEIGALDARHIRLFEPGWWTGYPPRTAAELATALGCLQQNALEPHADYRTPWELGATPEAISAFELDQLQRSVSWLRT
jgi:sugar phosphate isomerase/epimerase